MSGAVRFLGQPFPDPSVMDPSLATVFRNKRAKGPETERRGTARATALLGKYLNSGRVVSARSKEEAEVAHRKIRAWSASPILNLATRTGLRKQHQTR